MAQTVHVAPINDLVDHDLESDDCICGPRVEPVKASDGSVGWIVVHHAADGREFSESDYTGPEMPRD